MNLQFDWTINFPVVFAATGVLLALFKMWLQQRDFNRELLVILGKRSPHEDRSGVLGDVADLQDQTSLQEDLIMQHHAKLGLDRRHATRRTN